MLSVVAAATLGAFALVTVAAPAEAAFKEQTGLQARPGQPYGGSTREDKYDWLGSYLVDGKQVFCVNYALKEPDTDEKYVNNDVLKTKWGEDLPADVAANISYLLLRYGDTTDNDKAAALAHLLHSWTAAPRPGKDDLNPNRSFKDVGYDAPFHFDHLPTTAAKQAVAELTADAEANRGPWTAEVTAPKDAQTIGTAADWTIKVRNAKGKGVTKAPVTVEITDGALDDGTTRTKVTTNADGTASVRVTATGTNPKVAITLSAPAEQPRVQIPAPDRGDVQRVVATGGERQLTAQGGTTARNKPGAVRITKLDAKSGKGIPGVQLRVTGKDKTSAATGQDGKVLTGSDGKPVVVATAGDEGKATVENLRTPQEICVVEVSPPDGYDKAFDPANPPAACGTVQPGETLALAVSNVPNEVPTAIPAGAAPPSITVRGATTTITSPAGFATMGGLALLGSALVGFLARRRLGK
ncbi:MAG TPA: Ig-like domain-containing protein [Amycolatopsis sp.]|nr:Ig-like domain-containing protein [Amycolatopsis sp.]